MGTTHQIGGFAAGMGATVAGLPAMAADPGAGVVAAGAAVLSSKMPDVDLAWADGPNHRSFTHSLVVAGGGLAVGAYALASGLQASAAGGQMWGLPVTLFAGLIWGLLAGYLSHLVLDSLTSKGIPLVNPGGKVVGFRVLDTDGPGEALFVALLAAGLIAAGIALGVAAIPAVGGGILVMAYFKAAERYIGERKAERYALLAALAIVAVLVYAVFFAGS